MTNKEVIKSVGYNQQEIINNILKLHNKGRRLEFDPCYNRGGFYKNGVIERPEIKSDIQPLCPEVLELDVLNLPFLAGRFNSIIFDPPFIVSHGNGGIMKQKFGSFSCVKEFELFLYKALISLERVLAKGGILIIKCQDFVYGRKQYSVLNKILNMARDLGLEFKDIFILLAKSRPIGKFLKQQYSRKFHSYFLVFKKPIRKQQKLNRY
jgi:hypothetical protein